MAYGEPKDVEGQCNARMSIADNYGDNHTTIVCQLPPGHEGLHCEKYNASSAGQVTITWERHDESYDIDALEKALEDSIHLECGWDAIEKDYDYVNKAGESIPPDSAESDGLSVIIWTYEGRKVAYSVLGKDAVWVGGDTLTKGAAFKRIIATLRGEHV